ncbi:hypothetical protein J3R83DRAFT_897 [Lanmaoa asiatica]|nr:hypothetical protein J3R83DRAFT_897 [Lanmaoa asiatica]
MRAFSDPSDAALPGDATSLPTEESYHLQVARLYGLPRNVLRETNSLDLFRTAESTNAVPLAVDLSISSEGAQEEYIGQLSPPEVTPSHLRGIDHVWYLLFNPVFFANSSAQRMSIHLLMYFTHWINVHLQNSSDPLTTISISHGRWIFALLTKVEDQLSADEMNLLRNLARACLGLVQRYRDKHARNNAELEGASSPVLVENTTHMSGASCWMVFTAVAGYWGQRDLWADAEATLASA